ncbi:DNA-binding transcriptional regulator, AcrR family [Propionibacterium cyclohexanicum]|uniref:DNA-binding transcriptional regulator, AcrR family n=1 Tax=Propionibacterium cyclohexanicum TaxID=64702 RepID=A0A1H9U4N9_9ACTN|nr:TetR/AcrR family transcriptional regulator [Propionibacterium cyclohexanicum]SES04134.1 DNA-binding transcriptional regulator, AcrR family [Propionibacterium cyclohexanicum]
MARKARERLLESARELFAAQGIRAVSVEQILDASGVGRASFYRHFSGKDDLVIAVLAHYNEHWRDLLHHQVPERGAGVLGVFDILAQRFAAPDYRGCLALTALIEFRDPDHPIHQAAVEHQDRTATDLAALLDPAMGRTDRDRIGRQLLQLIDAAMLTALRDNSERPAQEARTTAAALLHQYDL